MKFNYLLSNIVNGLKRRSKSSFRKSKTKKHTEVKFRSSSILIKFIAILMVLLFIYFIAYPLISGIYKFNTVRDISDIVNSSEKMNNNRISILLIGLDKEVESYSFVDALSLITFDFETEQIGIFGINPDINVFLPKYQKSYQLRNIYTYPEATKREVPLLMNAVEDLLAIRIDRYALVDIKGFQDIFTNYTPAFVNLSADLSDPDISKFVEKDVSWQKGKTTIYSNEFLPFLATDVTGNNQKLLNQSQLFKEILQNIVTLQNIIKTPTLLSSISKNVKTDLSKKEMLQLLYFVNKISLDKYKIAYSKNESLIKVSNSFGIYSQYEPVLENIDNDISTILFNNSVLKEQAGIEILNGSDIPGLANARARWITNSGGRVIHFGNSIEKSNKTLIYILEPEKYPLTLTELKKVFNNNAEIILEEYKYKHFGEIVVIIGKEYE